MKQQIDVPQILSKLGACREASDWVRGQTGTPADLWASCPRGDWMLWIAAEAGVKRESVVLAACDCAELASDYWTDDIILACVWALDAARRWATGEGDIEEVKAARSAAVTYAADAAYAAAYAADAAYVAYAAYAADAAPHDAATRTETLRQCADIVREYISVEDVIKALESKWTQ